MTPAEITLHNERCACHGERTYRGPGTRAVLPVNDDPFLPRTSRREFTLFPRL